jgi:1-acyl-sn-glycerol-3-phosphate acyltransferase
MRPLVWLETSLRTLLGLVVLPLLLIPICLVALVTVPFGVSQRWFHRNLYLLFSRTAVGLAGSRIEVNGRQHIEPGQAYVVVSNHESNLDPFLIMHALPELIIRFVIKRQIMNVPLFGYSLGRTGNVTVDRRGAGDVQRIQQSMAARAPEVSILFFAEGTRARDGAFREFKKGAFATAIEERLPVLPIGMAGAFWADPPGTPILRRGAVALEVGAPLPVKDMKREDRDGLRDQAHAAVAALRAQARARVRAAGQEPGGRD